MVSRKIKLYYLLFKITFSISAFTFGGGYIVIPMIRKYFVNEHKFISESDLLDMAAIAQSTPGAIAVNLAVLVGYRIAGIQGAIITCIGTVLPPLIILSLISIFYNTFRNNRIISAILKGMEAGVAAIIVDIVIDMGREIVQERNWILTLLAPSAFIASFIFNINVLIIIIFCALISFLQTFVKSRKGVLENE
jgi:chromate transporter